MNTISKIVSVFMIISFNIHAEEVGDNNKNFFNVEEYKGGMPSLILDNTGDLENIFVDKNIKHGIFVSRGVSSDGVVSTGTHLDYSADPASKGQDKAIIRDTILGNDYSIGYNYRNTPEKGWGYEVSAYLNKQNIPQQNVSLLHKSTGEPFIYEGKPLVVDSPKSAFATANLHLGVLYNFVSLNKIIPDEYLFKNIEYKPYVGVGFTKFTGIWQGSHYNPKNTADESTYGIGGKASLEGDILNLKVGITLDDRYSIELERNKHRLIGSKFRSFDIDGLNSTFFTNKLNLIVHF